MVPSFSAAAMGLLNPSISTQHLYIVLAAAALLSTLGWALLTFISPSTSPKSSSALANFGRFFYASFLKPHTGDGSHRGQQAALESFYKAQVGRSM